MFSSVEVSILNIVMFYAMMSLSLNIVEQLIVLVFNVLFNLLTAVEFDIMRMIVHVMLFIKIPMIKSMFKWLFPVSMSSVVAKGMMWCDWLMDNMMGVEVSIVLNAMNVMMNIVSWVEFMGVRGVVVCTVSVISNVVHD